MKSLTLSKVAFLAVLATAMIFYGTVFVYNQRNPRAFLTTEEIAESGMLERCRQLCLAYGLVPTGHLANDAKAFLRQVKPLEEMETLDQMLDDGHFAPAPSQASPLLGGPAPSFALPDDRGSSVRLEELKAKGPVVLVFYYGYWCNHCVAQLFGLNEDLAKFKAAGAQVVAISADPPEQSAKRFAEYGRFDFPVLSDPDFQVATNYGAYTPGDGGEIGDLLHATFLIDRSGKIIWAQLGDQPWTDNKSLLVILSGLSQERDSALADPTSSTIEFHSNSQHAK